MLTTREIENEAESLREIKKKVPHYSPFNDDQHHAIDAQVAVLVEDLNETQIDGQYGHNEFVCHNAMAARAWLDGEAIHAPSEDWKDLQEKP